MYSMALPPSTAWPSARHRSMPPARLATSPKPASRRMTVACAERLPARHTATIAAFVGDTLFMPDSGTDRAGFPGGDARTLYRSARRVLSLPDGTRLFLCHDYKAPGRNEFRWETTVAAERADNMHVHDRVSEDEFVRMRTARDAQLGMPKLVLPSVQVNMRGGEFPPAEDDGRTYLKIPLNQL